MTQQWQEYRGPAPQALAGLGATPVHHDDAWWVRQDTGRVLVYPTGVGKALRWPGVSGAGRDAYALNHDIGGHNPSATPHDQKWALAGALAAIAAKRDELAGHNPSATPHDQKWALAGHDPTATPHDQKWALAGHDPRATPNAQKWALAGPNDSPSGWQILSTAERMVLEAGSGPKSWYYTCQTTAKFSQLTDGSGWRTWMWDGKWFAEKTDPQGAPKTFYKHDGSAALAGTPRGLGDANAFAQATTDLQNQVALPIQAGDTYLGAGDVAGALTAYQAAGQTAATTLGPEINSAEGGAATVTKPFTDFAWGLNGQLAAATDATAAQGLAHEMLVTYQDAISTGLASLNTPAPSGGPSQALLDAANRLKAYLDTNGVPSRHTSLQVVSDFQSAYIADGNTLKYGVDGKYGPVTAAALARVLGAAPSPKPAPGPGPSPGPAPGPSPGPITPSSSTSSGDYTVPILVGAGVLAASIVAVALYKRRGRGKARHAHAHA